MATTENKTGTSLRGRFWPQGAREDDKPIPGRLLLEPGTHPTLELDGAFTPLERETGRRKLPDGREAQVFAPLAPHELVNQSLTIHGTLDDNGEPVTLPAAFTIGGTYPYLGQVPGASASRPSMPCWVLT